MLTPDQLLSLIFIAIIFAAATIIFGGRAVLWLWGAVDQARYVTQSGDDGNEKIADVPEHSAFERAEQAPNVQPERTPNAPERLGPPTVLDGMIDPISAQQIARLANLYEAGQLDAEASIGLFFGVPRGGSKLYQALIAELRAELNRRGVQRPATPPAPAVTPIAGRPLKPGVVFEDDERSDNGAPFDPALTFDAYHRDA